MHQGQGPGLASRRLGEKGGTETVALTENQMTPHTHSLQAGNAPASSFVPDPNSSITRSVGGFSYTDISPPISTLHETALSEFGATTVTPHQNMQPFLAMYFIIALTGIYPSRS